MCRFQGWNQFEDEEVYGKQQKKLRVQQLGEERALCGPGWVQYKGQ